MRFIASHKTGTDNRWCVLDIIVNEIIFDNLSWAAANALANAMNRNEV